MRQLLVIKKDNTRELFEPEKIRNGIIHACHKRPVASSDIDRIVLSVEQFAYNSLQEEITTKQIGEMVMAALRKLDEVAYVRFASVYRQFTDIPTFLRELTRLLQEPAGNDEKNGSANPDECAGAEFKPDKES